MLLLVLNLPLVGIWVKLLQIPRPYLYAGILTFAVLGAYAVNFSIIDIVILRSLASSDTSSEGTAIRSRRS